MPESSPNVKSIVIHDNSDGLPVDLSSMVTKDHHPKSTLGARLRTARVAKGVSQSKLTPLVGCTRTYIVDLEHDRALNPSAMLVMRIADVLDISTRWLVTGHGLMAKWVPLHDDERALILTYQSLPEPLQKQAREYLSFLATHMGPSKAVPYPSTPAEAIKKIQQPQSGLGLVFPPPRRRK